MNNPRDDEVLTELKRITKLLILIATKDQKQRKQIEILDGIGFKPMEIAELLGTTANNVRVTLHSMRKKGKPPKGETEQPSNRGSGLL